MMSYHIKQHVNANCRHLLLQFSSRVAKVVRYLLTTLKQQGTRNKVLVDLKRSRMVQISVSSSEE